MKKKMSLLAVLLMAVAVTAYSVSGTYAKYTSTTDTKSDIARVAKWDIDFNTTDTENHAFTFDLFNTILDSDASTETDVWQDGIGKLIAPGTSGKFVISLLNNSEVAAQYAIDFDVTNGGNIPLEYKIGSEGTWSSTLSDISASSTTEISRTTATDVEVYWRWAFENGTGSTLTANDTADTTLGTEGTATVTVSAAVTAVQVD